MVLLQPLKRADHPVIPIARNRRALPCPVGFQLAPRDPQPLNPATATQNRTAQHRSLQIHLQLLRLRLRLVIARAALALSQPPLRIRQRLTASLR
jgi:hypothetical protein